MKALRRAYWTRLRKFSTLGAGAVDQLQESLNRLEESDARLDSAAYGSLLQQCGNAKALAEGRRVYAHMVASGQEPDTYVRNRLVEMLGKCGSIEDARAEFDKMPQRDVFSWNIMIGAYVQCGHSREALRAFWQMDLEGVKPSNVTFISILRACASADLLAHGVVIHARVVAAGIELDVFLATAFLSMYRKCGRVDDARRVFDAMPSRDVIAWNAMIATYAQYGHLDEALELFKRMNLEGAKPTKATFISVLDASAKQGVIEHGKTIHACVVDSGFERDVMVATSLVNMYGKCGSLHDAKGVFNRLHSRDVISWNAIIEACCEHEKHKDAFQLFGQMDLEGYSPNESTYVSIVGACSAPDAIAEGKIVHGVLLSSEFQSDVVESALTSMYAKCGRLEDARRMFEKQSYRDVISWTAMIAAYAQLGHDAEALELFHRIDLEGLKPDDVTFLGALGGCSTLAEGRLLHARVAANGYITDMQVTALISMYGKCGSLDDARSVFEQKCGKNMVAWTAMIAACAQCGQDKEAVVIFQKMDLEGLRPNEVTFVSVLDACASVAAIRQGKAIHQRVIASDLKSELVDNSILNMYGRCGSLDDARSVFESLRSKDLVSWSALIGANTQHGHVREVLELFGQMELEGVNPDDVIFVSILSACSHAGLIAESRGYFLSMVGDHGVVPTAEHYGCMLDLLGRAGRLDDAEDLINNMPFEPTGMLWMSLMGACTTHTDVNRGSRIAKQVGAVNPETAAQYILLANMYAASGRWGDAAKVRKRMEAMGVKKRAGRSWIEVESSVHESVQN